MSNSYRHKTLRRGVATAALGLAGIASAQPNVEFSGIIDTGVATVSNTGDGTQRTSGFVNSILGVSNVGVKVTQELPHDLSAFANLQAGFGPSSGAESAPGTLFSRNAYVGLKNSYGALSIGKQWNFNDDWLVGSVFLGGYNSGAVFKFSEFDAVSELYNSTVKYVSPTYKNFTGGVFYSTSGAAGSNRAGRVYNFALKYADGPLLIAGNFDHEISGTNSGTVSTVNTGTTYSLATLGAHYDFGFIRARLGYTHASISGPGGVFQSIPALPTRTAYAVEPGLDWHFTPDFTLSTDVVFRRDTTLANKTGVYRLLGMYTIDKNLSVFANVAYLKNSGGATEALLNTNSTAFGGGYANQTQNSVALGLRYSF